jgi:hypothetical protein
MRLWKSVAVVLTAAMFFIPEPATAVGVTAAPMKTRAVTLYFLGGDGQPYDAVARVSGRKVVGWLGVADTDDTVCFRGTVTRGRLVGKTFRLNPESGEWYVGPLVVRGSGTGSRFRLTSVLFREDGETDPTWHEPLSKARPAEVDSARGEGYAGLIKAFPSQCTLAWRQNS